MREILFRGKLKCNGDWSYGNLIVKPNVISLITPDDTPLGRYGEIDPETVGQYTGLTDRNGKKIFEGDIIKTKRHENITEHTYNDRSFSLTCELCLELEVIGNIYDNPELIKVVVADYDLVVATYERCMFRYINEAGNIYDTRGNKFN